MGKAGRGEKEMGIMHCRKFAVVAVALVVFCSCVACVAQAGVLCNPAGTMGKGNASLGVEYDYRRGITDNDVAVGTDSSGEVKFLSNRYLARAGLGAFDWLDLYLRIGAADLGFPQENPGDPRFAGSTRFAMGGGFALRLFETDNDAGLNARALLLGQGLRFSSHGNTRVPIPGTSDSFRAFRNEYTWNEIDLGLLLAFTTPSLDSGGKVRLTPYVGLEKSFIDGEIERSEFLLAAGQKSLLGSETVDFADDGLTVRPVVGMEVNVPQKYSITFEMTIIDSDEFSFGVGISQITALKRTVVKEKASDHKM